MILYSIRSDGRLCDPLCSDDMETLRFSVKKTLNPKLLKGLGLSIDDFEIVLLGDFNPKNFAEPILISSNLRYMPVKQFLKKGGARHVQTEE